MDGGHTSFLLLQFFGITGLTVALVAHQLWSLKKLELKRLDKERAAEQAEATQAS
jgi:hypothetical protein